MKKVNQASLLSVESRHTPSPKKIVEVNDRVKVRVAMDSGAAGHVMLETNVTTCQTRAQNINE